MKGAAAFVVFLAVLWIPLAGMFLGAGTYVPADENRNPAPLPKIGWGWRTWIDSGPAFTAYFHDHFAFRRQIVAAQALFKIQVLGVSSSASVVIGKQGWLFYSGEQSQEGDIALWADLFERRRNALSSRGTRALFVIARQTEHLSGISSFVQSGENRIPLGPVDANLEPPPRAYRAGFKRRAS